LSLSLSSSSSLSLSFVAGIVGGDADNNIVELAKVGAEDFQLNVKDTLTPFQTIGCALSSICAEK
jgi:hypothetical protein